jgi:hypothetical protein
MSSSESPVALTANRLSEPLALGAVDVIAQIFACNLAQADKRAINMDPWSVRRYVVVLLQSRLSGLWLKTPSLSSSTICMTTVETAAFRLRRHAPWLSVAILSSITSRTSTFGPLQQEQLIYAHQPLKNIILAHHSESCKRWNWSTEEETERAWPTNKGLDVIRAKL